MSSEWMPRSKEGWIPTVHGADLDKDKVGLGDHI